MINNCNQEPTQEKLQEIQKRWREVLGRVNISTQQFESLLRGLQVVLPKYYPPQQFADELKIYFEKNSKLVSKFKQELKQMGKEVEDLAEKMQGVDIPEEFIDMLMGIPMKDPYKDGHGHVADKSTWERILKTECPKNPWTLLPVTRKDITQDINLKRKIDNFFNASWIESEEEAKSPPSKKRKLN